MRYFPSEFTVVTATFCSLPCLFLTITNAPLCYAQTATGAQTTEVQTTAVQITETVPATKAEVEPVDGVAVEVTTKAAIKTASAEAGPAEDVPSSKDGPDTGPLALDNEETAQDATNPAKRLQTSLTGRTELATRLRDPDKVTKARQYLYWRGKYSVGEFANTRGRANFHFTLRGHYDAVYDLTDRYPRAVERDEQSDLDVREAVLALNLGKVDLRIGRQQVVWGESVGLFFADVVNPKDLREFLVRDLDDIRIPLWGIDTVVSVGQNRALEFFWSPEARFSKLPQPGSEFDVLTSAIPPGVQVNLNAQRRPSTGFDNSTFGVRYSHLINDIDAAVFYLRAFDDLPAVSKMLTMPGGVPTLDVALDHPRVNRFGATLSKPLGKSILKSELVYATGRRFETQAFGPANERNYITGMVGINYPLSRYNLDAQFFQSSILGNGAPLRGRKGRSGVSLRLADDASLRKIRPELLLVGSLNEKDVWFSPKVHYRLSEAATLTLGVDYFNGRRETLFGQFHRASRAQAQVTWRMF